MKVFQILIFVNFLFATSIAQDKVTIGTPYNISGTDYRNNFVFNNSIFTISTIRNIVTICEIDAFRQTRIYINDFIAFREKSFVEGFFKKGNSLFIFASFWDRVNKKDVLYMREFDLERRITTYNINHENLSINTKEVDLAINPAQAIENDVVNTVVNNDCILGPLTGVTGATSHEYIDLRPLITTEVINNDDLISMLIDVKNRKTINGYPTLDLVYYRYLNADVRCSGSTSNTLNSDSINQFIELIGTYWLDLLEQIVPATTIWGSSLTNSDSGVFNGGGSGTNKFVYRKGEDRRVK